MGLLRRLDLAFEGNYALLNCSVDHLLKSRGRLLELSRFLQTDLSTLLAEESCIPDLATARKESAHTLRVLVKTVLREIERYPEEPPPDAVPEMRKALCLAFTQLQGYLQEAFGKVVAADPRSHHDADYVLSKRFTRDLEESESLHGSVSTLNDYLHELRGTGQCNLGELARKIELQEAVPLGPAWDEIVSFLDELDENLTPRLREVLSKRSIRLSEAEILSQHTTQLPLHCRLLREVHAIHCELAEQLSAVCGASPEAREQSERDLGASQEVLSRRMIELMQAIDQHLGELAAFLPIWRLSLERRRALFLRKKD